jgi:O-antigen/teichoic acid export membrane protein
MKKLRLKSLFASGDKDFVEVIQHSFWAIVLLAGGTIIQFVFDFSLTHTFDAHGAGIFYLCFSVLSALALIGRLGVDRAVVRFIPPLLSKKPGEAAGVHRTATQLSLAFTVPLTILMFMSAPFVAKRIFHSSELTPYLQIFAFAIPPLALNYVFSGVLRALKRIRSALSIERLTMYAIGIVAVLTLGQIYGLKAASIGFVVAIFISTIEGEWYIRKHMPPYEKAVPFNKKRLIVVSAPLLFVVFAAQMSGQASVLLLGAMSSNANVGIFNIALRVSMILNLVLIAVNAIAATKISELYAASKHEALRSLIGKISALSTLAGVPLFLILAFFSHFWLGLFGGAFAAGGTTLIILTAGQLVNVSTGSNNFILAMTGHERALATAVGISMVLNVGLGLALIPSLDVLGAGLATAIAMVVSNVIMLIMVKHYIGVWSLPFSPLMTWFRKAKKP